MISEKKQDTSSGSKNNINNNDNHSNNINMKTYIIENVLKCGIISGS